MDTEVPHLVRIEVMEFAPGNARNAACLLQATRDAAIRGRTTAAPALDRQSRFRTHQVPPLFADDSSAGVSSSNQGRPESARRFPTRAAAAFVPRTARASASPNHSDAGTPARPRLPARSAQATLQ